MLFLNGYSNSSPEVEEPLKNNITFGILQGGGSIIGFDYERLVTDRIGLQLGAGLFGAGAGVNFHLKPEIRSSFISLAYWHQGFGDFHAQSIAGSTFVYRANKWFTAQFGLDKTLTQGPAWPTEIQQSNVILLYSIGGYIPF
jgi:hypothetical protein